MKIRTKINSEYIYIYIYTHGEEKRGEKREGMEIEATVMGWGGGSVIYLSVSLRA